MVTEKGHSFYTIFGYRVFGGASVLIKEVVKGSATIEMAYIMPVIFLIFTSTVYLMFYYHDKNILAGAVYETAVVGSQKIRAAGADDADEGGAYPESAGSVEESLETLFHARIRRKLILFPGAAVSVNCTEKQIEVTAKAVRKKMRVTVTGRAAVTKPEKFIRNHRKLHGVVAG